MALFEHITEPTKIDVLVGFFDLTGFMQIAESLDSLELIDLLDGYFQLTGDILEETGGTLIKTIGDAGLAMYPAEAADQGVRGFFRLKNEGDAWLAERGVRSEAIVKLHIGPVAYGKVGESWNIFGHAVNIAAVMESHGFAMSPQVFRKLEPETRKLFKKHTPPITYIPMDEPHAPHRKRGWRGIM